MSYFAGRGEQSSDDEITLLDNLAALAITGAGQAITKTGATTFSNASVGGTDATISLTDITTNNVSTTKHGFTPKAPNDATKFLDGTAAYDTVKDSDLSTSDITTNDVTTSKHGFVPKAPNNTTTFLRGDATWAAAASTPPSRPNFTWPLDAIGTDGNKYDTIFDGSGDMIVTEGGFICRTLTTDGSASECTGVWSGGPGGIAQSVFGLSPEITSILRMSSNTTTANVSWFLLGVGGGPDNAAALVGKHAGFILDTTVLYASNASGTTQTTTDISSGVTMNVHNTFRALGNGSTNFTYYVNATLKATHTTNLPTGIPERPWTVGVNNDTGVTTSRSMLFGPIVVSWDDD